MFPELYKNMEELHRLVEPFRLEYEYKRSVANLADAYERMKKKIGEAILFNRVPRPGILGKLARIFRLSYGWVDEMNILFDLAKQWGVNKS